MSNAPRLIDLHTAQSTAAKARPAAAPMRRVSSKALLGDGNSLLIDHEGVAYVLRATRFGKLILTK